MKNILELKNIHKNKDIYIIASGKSVDFYNLDFFDNKILIGVNQVYKKFKCDYLVRKENKFLKKSLETGAKVIVSKHDSGNNSSKVNTIGYEDEENLYYFKHDMNYERNIDVSVFHKDNNKIVVSYSTITSAMHIAAHMGAKNIILIGHDCGEINNESTFGGYYDSISDTPWDNWTEYKNWLKVIEDQSIIVKQMIKNVYDANVVSSLPFVSLNLENNKYR